MSDNEKIPAGFAQKTNKKQTRNKQEAKKKQTRSKQDTRKRLR
jgi:hypothetical protein